MSNSVPGMGGMLPSFFSDPAYDTFWDLVVLPLAIVSLGYGAWRVLR